jgi:hypothetical protein
MRTAWLCVAEEIQIAGFEGGPDRAITQFVDADARLGINRCDRGRETAGVNRIARKLGRMARANLKILGGRRDRRKPTSDAASSVLNH